MSLVLRVSTYSLAGQKFAERLVSPIASKRSESKLRAHDQYTTIYTTIVRSKPAQMVLNHPKLRRLQR